MAFLFSIIFFLSLTSVGVLNRKWAWSIASGRGQSQVGVANRKWAWSIASGRGQSQVGVVNRKKF